MSTLILDDHDGVGLAMRGNLMMIVYSADARLHRTRWVFDRADEFIARRPEGIYGLMTIDGTGDLPDGPTRRENATRFKALGMSLRILVTVPLGDALRVTLIKAVMRAMVLVQGQAGRHLIANTEAEGIEKLRAAMNPSAPSREQLESDLAAIRQRLSAASPRAVRRAG